MGFQDRNYYDDPGNRDPWSTDPDAWKGGSGVKRRRTIVTTLIIINVAIFLLDAFVGPTKADQAAFDSTREQVYQSDLPSEEKQATLRKLSRPSHMLAGTLSLPANVVQRPWKIWTLLSHGFAHASITSSTGFWHVAFNMMVLFFLGRPVEQRYGRDRFLRFYLLAILVSGLGWLLFQLAMGNVNKVALGASGAVSGIVALFVFNFPNEKIYLWGVLGMKAWVLGILIVAMDLFRAFDPTSNIAWEAHLAGFAFGAAAFYFKWNFAWLKLDWIGNLFTSRTKLKVHAPETESVNDEKLKEQADQVLAKIASEGEQSLTSKERRILKRYSKSIRSKREN